jgi:hypothetical protein
MAGLPGELMNCAGFGIAAEALTVETVRAIMGHIRMR